MLVENVKHIPWYQHQQINYINISFVLVNDQWMKVIQTIQSNQDSINTLLLPQYFWAWLFERWLVLIQD